MRQRTADGDIHRTSRISPHVRGVVVERRYAGLSGAIGVEKAYAAARVRPPVRYSGLLHPFAAGDDEADTVGHGSAPCHQVTCPLVPQARGQVENRGTL